MSQANRTIKTLSLTDLKSQLEALLEQVSEGETQAVIERDGKQLAALVSIDDLRRIQRDRDFQALETFGRGFEDTPLDELEREVADALREARAELRGQRENPAPHR